MSPPRRAAAARLGIAAAPSLIALALYAPTVGYDFVAWDDPTHVTENARLGPPADWAAIWTTPHEGLYAPLSLSLWALLRALDARSAAPFHAANLLLFVGLVAVLRAALRRLLEARAGAETTGPPNGLPAPIAASLAAAWFATHPLLVEPVAWVSGLRDLLAALLVLACLALTVSAGTRRDAPPRRGLELAAGLAGSAALLAKPSAIGGLALVFTLDALWLGRPARAALRRLGLPLLIALPLAVLTRGLQPSATVLDPAPRALAPLAALDAVGWYAARIVLPWPLIADVGRTTTRLWESGALLVSWLPGAALLGLAGWRRRSPLRPHALALAAVAALAPTLGLVPFTFQSYSNVADRFALLALLPVALGAAALARASRRAAAVLGALTLVGLLLSSAQRATWRDDEALFTHVLRHRPDSAMAATNLGRRRLAQGRTAEAIALLRRAVAVRPDYFAARVNLAAALLEQRDTEAVIELLSPLVERGPPSPAVHVNLGAALVLSGRIDEGVAHYRRALALDPGQADAWNNLGAVELAYGRAETAAEAFERALRLRPHDAGYRRNLERARAARTATTADEPDPPP